MNANPQASGLEEADSSSGAKQGLNDPAFIEDIRRQMLKFANLQLNDSHLAEDAVQDALIGAMKNAKSFAGRSAFKTWMFAILKNKIIDIIRKRQRQVEVTSLASDSEEDEDFSVLFDETGHWNDADKPQNWGMPEQNFKQDQFWVVFDACLNGLPPKQAKVFMMREFIGLDTNEICNNEDLSVSNLHVILYRARMRLQKCLELRWYNGDGGENREKL